MFSPLFSSFPSFFSPTVTFASPLLPARHAAPRPLPVKCQRMLSTVIVLEVCVCVWGGREVGYTGNVIVYSKDKQQYQQQQYTSLRLCRIQFFETWMDRTHVFVFLVCRKRRPEETRDKSRGLPYSHKTQKNRSGLILFFFHFICSTSFLGWNCGCAVKIH